MSVGFKLPNGSQSRAYNLVTRGEVMDLTAHPFEAGLTPDEFNDLISRRYGHAIQFPGEVFQLPDTQGLHISDYQSALEEIALKNPAWFKDNGLGDATGAGTFPTDEEAHDAKYAARYGDMVLAEAKILGGVVAPPPPPPPPPPVDPPPVDPPPPPPPPGPPVVVPVSTDIKEKILDLVEYNTDFTKYHGVMLIGPGRQAKFGRAKQLADAVKAYVEGLQGVVKK